jgi:hypothetical protein
MLPSYIFDNPALLCYFFDGPLSSTRIKHLISLYPENVQSPTMVVNFNEYDVDNRVTHLGLEDWIDKVDEFSAGTMLSESISVHYEYGWELVIVGIPQMSAARSFFKNVARDSFFKTMWLTLDEFIDLKKSASSGRNTERMVTEFCKELERSYRNRMGPCELSKMK